MAGMTKNRSEWVVATLLALAACEPPKDGGDDGSEETGGSEVSGGEEVTSEASSDASYSTSAGSSVSVTIGDDSHGDDGCSDDEGGSATSTSTTGGEDSGNDTVSEGGSAEACGVDVEYTGQDTVAMCGCATCDVQFDGVSDASFEAILNACDCICEAVGCGDTNTGGVTTGAGEDDGGTATSTTAGSGEDDGGSISGTATSGWDDDGGDDGGDYGTSVGGEDEGGSEVTGSVSVTGAAEGEG